MLIRLLMVSMLALHPSWAWTAEDDTPVTTSSQERAATLLSEMAHYMAGLPRFSVDLIGGFEVVQESGQKIQFLEAREMVLQRPNQFRSLERSGDEIENMVLFDGESMTVFHAPDNVYAQATQPGGIDDATMYFIRDLRMNLPLAPLFITRFPEELARHVQIVDYVEMSQVLGQPAHHLAARTASVDFQVWISASDEPLPLRFVLTYPEPGLPQFFADLANWNLKPRIKRDTFTFTAPEAAHRIPFAVQVDLLMESLESDQSEPETTP